MQITNNAKLPGAIVEAIRNDDYTPGCSDITVTQLISSPRIRVLKRRHAGDIIEDASDMIFALLGKAIHYILEKSEPTALVEQRLYITAAGWKLGGQFDRMTIRQATLQDYKVSSVWEAIYGLKTDRIAQLNVLAYIAKKNGYKNISNLEIVAIFRDWSKAKARYNSQYPQRQVQRIKVPMWEDEQIQHYITDRIHLHQKAEKELPECTQEDRWATDDKWAVMKKGRKSAIRVSDNKDVAQKMVDEKGTGHYLEFRPGENKRCDNYCSVSTFCEQYQRLKEIQAS